MLGRANTKKLFTLKMLDGAGIKKAALSQYVRRGAGTKKLFPPKMLGGFAIKEACQTQTRKNSFHVKC